ncbi:hypothetical protein PIB30_014774 [Stylosanthes scabra]|uniref:Uncharacterized protein n=1 Tax=Stylosanthes scabra TaxID=79078 RepID=A0ABU6Y4X8_9FABA|nr:hypothetical protein [Stylosanthes scabra]
MTSGSTGLAVERDVSSMVNVRSTLKKGSSCAGQCNARVEEYGFPVNARSTHTELSRVLVVTGAVVALRSDSPERIWKDGVAKRRQQTLDGAWWRVGRFPATGLVAECPGRHKEWEYVVVNERWRFEK